VQTIPIAAHPTGSTIHQLPPLRLYHAAQELHEAEQGALHAGDIGAAARWRELAARCDVAFEEAAEMHPEIFADRHAPANADDREVDHSLAPDLRVVVVFRGRVRHVGFRDLALATRRVLTRPRGDVR
jgi:hypothetical protein